MLRELYRDLKYNSMGEAAAIEWYDEAIQEATWALGTSSPEERASIKRILKVLEHNRKEELEHKQDLDKELEQHALRN